MKKGGNWLYGVCAALLPVIALLHLYRQNINDMLFEYLAAVSAGCVLVSLILFVISYTLSKSPLTAFLVTLAFWVVFFSVGAIISLSEMLNTRTYVFFIGLAIAWGILLALIFLFRCKTWRQRCICILVALGSVAAWYVLRYALGLTYSRITAISILAFLLACIFLFTRRWKTELPLRFFALFTGFLFLMNGLPVLIHQLNEPAPPNPTAFERQLAVDDSLPSPNVYWFHCDGMVGFEGVERFWGDAQVEFKQALQVRGFAVNPSANFESWHKTRNAIPILMCPEYYDSELSFFFDPAYAFARAGLPVPEGYVPGTLPQKALNAAREKTELVTIFEQAGYHVSTISNETTNFIFQGSQFYNLSNPERMLVNASHNASTLRNIWLRGCANLLRSSFLFDIDKRLISKQYSNPQYYSAIEQRIPDTLWEGLSMPPKVPVMAQSLADILEQPGPKLTLINFDVAHFPFVWDENGNETGDNQLDDYWPQHRFAAKVLLKLVDLVLEKDPDAVIVLMADHGVHNQSIESIMAQKQCSVEEARLLHNSVLSAVRAPETKESLPSDPRDISRYLVNSFVGQNYEYINGPLP